MDFKDLKEKALNLKDKAVKKTNNLIDSSSKKLQESSFVLKDEKAFLEFIKKSKNYTNKDLKEIKKKVIIICALKDSSFYKKALYMIPVLYTKSWAQNMPLKMSSIDIKLLEKYWVTDFPSLLVFENEKILKFVPWEDNIEKVVKSLTLDINETIDKL